MSPARTRAASPAPPKPVVTRDDPEDLRRDWCLALVDELEDALRIFYRAGASQTAALRKSSELRDLLMAPIQPEATVSLAAAPAGMP